MDEEVKAQRDFLSRILTAAEGAEPTLPPFRPPLGPRCECGHSYDAHHRFSIGQDIYPPCRACSCGGYFKARRFER